MSTPRSLSLVPLMLACALVGIFVAVGAAAAQNKITRYRDLPRARRSDSRCGVRGRAGGGVASRCASRSDRPDAEGEPRPGPDHVRDWLRPEARGVRQQVRRARHDPHRRAPALHQHPGVSGADARPRRQGHDPHARRLGGRGRSGTERESAGGGVHARFPSGYLPPVCCRAPTAWAFATKSISCPAAPTSSA